jgi:dienelactone hydrolase
VVGKQTGSVHKLLAAVTVLACAVAVAVMVLWSALERGPTITDAAAPVNAPGSDFRWYHAAAPGAHSIPIGVIRGIDGHGSRRPALLLVTGTDGFSTDHVQFAREMAARGFDVAIGCWFRTDGPTGAGRTGIACPQAPDFKGVSEAAVADLDALVRGARMALGHPGELALVGMSRGGGIAMLRATHGATEPVVSVAGMVEGTTDWGQLPTEVDVVPLADRVEAPVLLLHGEDDQLVPIAQAQHLASALEAAGVPVETHWYPGAPHGLISVPEIRADLQLRITDWLSAGALSR